MTAPPGPEREWTPDERAVLEANAAFYAAFESGDLDAMDALWLDDPSTVCVHPGNQVVTGTAAIHRAWTLVMAATPYIQFVLTDLAVLVSGTSATVICTENVIAAAPTGATEAGPGDLVGGSVRATNSFRLVDGAWRLHTHHTGPQEV